MHVNTPPLPSQQSQGRAICPGPSGPGSLLFHSVLHHTRPLAVCAVPSAQNAVSLDMSMVGFPTKLHLLKGLRAALQNTLPLCHPFLTLLVLQGKMLAPSVHLLFGLRDYFLNWKSVGIVGGVWVLTAEPQELGGNRVQLGVWVQMTKALSPRLIFTEARLKVNPLARTKIRGSTCPISCFCGMGCSLSGKP